MKFKEIAWERAGRPPTNVADWRSERLVINRKDIPVRSYRCKDGEMILVSADRGVEIVRDVRT